MRPTPAAFPLARAKHPVLLVAFLLTAIARANDSAAANELGRPIVRDFPPGRSGHLHYLCQAVTQDSAGFIYLANNIDLRCYDGTTWRKIKVPTESAGIRKFARAADGTIYAGGASIIGYLRGSGASAEFVSLADQLPPTELGCDEIFDVLAVGQTVYFADEEKILVWRDGRFSVIPCRSPPGSRGASLHGVGGTVYAGVRDRGLCRLRADRLETVADDPVVRQNQIVLIEAGPAGALVLLTADRGFFQLVAGRATPLATEANRWLAGKGILRAQRLADGSLAVLFNAVSGYGGMRLGFDGRYLGPLDNTIGLYLKTLRDLFCDREGGLWLGSEVGMFRLEWPSAVTVFDAVNGLGGGGVTDVARHEGVLYAATGEGVFRLIPSDVAGRCAKFERISASPAYSLISHPGGLLVLGYAGLFLQSPTGRTAIAGLPPGGGVLHRSKRDPDRVWIGTAHGIQSVRNTLEGWRDEGPVSGFDENVRGLAEAADGALWVATLNRGLFRLEFDRGNNPAPGVPRVERFGDNDGLPGKFERANVVDWDGELVFLMDTAARPFRFERNAGRFVEFMSTAPLPAGPFAVGWAGSHVETGGSETLWLAAQTGLYGVSRAGGESRRLPHLVTANAGAIARLHEETGPEGRVLWICGSRGLVRVEVERAFVAPGPFAAHLKSAEVGEGGRLPHRHAPLKFDYIALRHQFANTVSYQTRLVGDDRGWSPWSSQRERVFTNLGAGSYRFEVRARDADNHLSAAASLTFTVLPPWWRTWWALLAYGVAGTGAIAGVVRLRTRTLRQRAERLEGIVTERTRQLAQRTAELAQKNVELTRLHRLELDEKTAARLAEEKARLEVLRYQLNPHFLFNTLASISASLPAGRTTARAMVERLAEFCRLTLHRADDREWSTLGEEMRLLHAYLEIERSRWGDLLDLELDCDPALDDERLPHFVLLPLVENALKYGRATSPDRVGLRLAARRDPGRDTFVIEVANTGEWVEPGAPRGVSTLGIGLENLRERLRRVYPQTHDLTLSHAGGWVTATLRLTAHRQETDDRGQATGERRPGAGDRRPETVSPRPPSAAV